MTPERWQQIDALLEKVLACPVEDRPDLLESACSEDLELRREVESLLGFAETRDFIDQPAFSVHDEDPEVGRQIGPYQIRRLLGRGGMGAVYLALRQGDFEQQVTLKLIKRGMDSDEILFRFQNERQILADLDHPNIARLLDGGTDDDGRPYFAMEYIEGEPIDAYCDRRKLSIDQRLELFLQVCSAVLCAHQNLVVHRDLKPGNILVTHDGPKLLDFGIAKLLGPEAAPDARLTSVGRAPMTLEYASPEQVRGGAITTASDTYSLGVILYELLSGHSPYYFGDADSLECARRIREEEPGKPSTAVRHREDVGTSTITPESVSETREGSPRQLRRRLAGDLDSIVLKALRKEPRERYGSVEQLSEDIRRHLGRQPVLARKGTFSYRAGKFVRRNKLTLGVLLLIVVSGLTTTVWWRQAVAANERAVEQRLRAENALEFLKSLFKASDPDETKGRVLTARNVLERGESRVDDLDDPVLKADVLATLGSVYRNLGLYQKARDLMERSVGVHRTLHPLVS